MWAAYVKTKDGTEKTATARSLKYILKRLGDMYPSEMDEQAIDTVVIGNRPAYCIQQGRKNKAWE